MSDDGYTLSDLKQMQADLREGWDKIIRDRQMGHMELLGPDVYFHVLGAEPYQSDTEADTPGDPT